MTGTTNVGWSKELPVKRRSKEVLLLVFLLCGTLFSQVRVWEEPLVLPTYEAKSPDVNPMFWRPMVYQGASRVIYPYPLMDNVTNVRGVRTYKALYLENEYIKLCVLPELGGRLFYATDKTNGYEMFYRQHVIKPALIGMLGAWISGGIEWCVFHHHRASSFMPVDYTFTENADGSKTIWIGEIEPRQRMKWAIGVTLYPGRSYIEAQVKMFNRTENANSILYWANVATHANENYQVVFPPSTEYGTYHAKNYFAHWPIANEKYLNRDYVGVDLSWWKNHPSPVSIFAYDLREGFLAGIDHGRKAGTMHVANHRIVAGAKLWEWGPGDAGSMWDTKVLTDSDGPYAELMVGAYSDNQPDYSWIKPYEVKSFKQYWYPLRDLVSVKRGNVDAAVDLEMSTNGTVTLAFNVTRKLNDAHVVLKAKNKEIFSKSIDIDPGHPFHEKVTLAKGVRETDLSIALLDSDGNVVLSYEPVQKEYNPKLPEAVKPPPAPHEIKTVEELYLTGLRIKQFHNALINPADYFNEALKRDPGNSRCNVQLGLEAQRRGLYEEAAGRYRTAIARISKDYTRPMDCEAYYQLGLVLKAQGKLEAAYDTLYRATWDHAFHSAAFYNLAELSCMKKDYGTALENINRSLSTNSVNTKGLNLRSTILRKLDRLEEAEATAMNVVVFDPLDARARNEQYLNLLKQGSTEDAQIKLKDMTTLMRDAAESYLELAVDYLHGGFYDEARDVLTRAVALKKPGISNYPTIYYYLGYLSSHLGDSTKKKEYYSLAGTMPTDYCFPFRLETINVYESAIEFNSRDSRLHYYLGNLLYDLQPERAILEWEKSVALDSTFAIAYRNLGWAYNYAKKDLPASIRFYEKAIASNRADARYFQELDRLYEEYGTPVEKRLKLLEDNHSYVKARSTSLLREIMVLVQSQKYDRAIQYLADNYFPAQEETAHLHDTYVDAHLLRGKMHLSAKDYRNALADFLASNTYPENHSIGRSPDYARNPQVNYYIGVAYEKLGNSGQAKECLGRAIHQNVKGSEFVYYQALAHRLLGHKAEADSLFEALIELGQKRIEQSQDVDFFAKFSERESKKNREAEGHFIKGLGNSGKGRGEEARKQFEEALELNPNHVWARAFLKDLT